MPRREADKIDRCIGENLYRLRNERNLSRDELSAALRTKMTPQAFLKYEDGRTRIPAAAMVELARLLNVPLADLFSGVEELLPKGVRPLVSDPAVMNVTKAMAIDLAKKEK